MKTFIKDPQAKLDFGFDWGTYWLQSGETISISTWTIPDGLTQVAISNTDSTTTVWISGGTADTDYTITNHIKTSESREDDRSMIIKVRSR